MIRAAVADDLATLSDLERAASTAALSHVFPPDLPYPDDDVRATWRLRLDDPRTEVLLAVRDGSEVAYAAHADGWLQHFGVEPRSWGTGLSRVLHDDVMARMRAAGHRTARLWVLAENGRARRFYRRCGWHESGDTSTSPYPPHPVTIEMTLDLEGH